jgi:hypothetical protein
MTAAGYGAADRLLRTGDTSTGTLTLAGNPPLALPSGTAGWLLVCDASGNLTLQSPVSGAPTGSASGDLSGSYPGPTVSGVTGVAISGTPASGDTLVVQSGGTTAQWQAPAGGTPSGSASGDLSGTYPGPAVAGLTGIPITGTAAAGNALTVGSGATSLTWVTPAAGVTLDGTGTDIQPLGAQSAGSSGQAAKADHVHATTSIIDGVTVSGTPATGKVPICTSSSAATWQTPASGVTLDSTASDIHALAASAVAGSVGQAADAGHIHPWTSLALLSGAAFTGAVSCTKAVTSGVVALSDAGTISVNAANGNTFRVTLGGNRTMGTPSNPADGQMILFEIMQDLTGSRTLAWSGAYLFTTSLPAPTLTTTASYVDVVGFKFNSSAAKWRCLAVSLGYSE